MSEPFLQEVEPRIHDKLDEEILALNGVKFQLALKVQLRKDNPEGSEEYTVVVVVALLFYVHGKHLRSCRDGQLT